MDVLWISLLAVPVLLWSSGTFLFYFKTILYFVSMVCLAVVTIPMCILKSGGRNVENMRFLIDRVIRFLVQHVKYLMGLRFVVSGRENLQVDGPYVIISNHQSSLDVLGQMEVLPDRCVSVAKRELLLTGAVGLACWLGGTIFINRKKTDDAKSIMAATARTMLKDQVRLWVFPEGTRNHEGDLLPFKKGAFHLAVQAQGTSLSHFEGDLRCSRQGVPHALSTTLNTALPKMFDNTLTAPFAGNASTQDRSNS
ncbi:1-acyl-sn-glycerol-3-phosphate acyltransferase alpha-like isoform X4 [Anguilla rostrata]|uniref:1-acyl-sn-glycerol-3-phosphate acyltransferase alpha-like isoform X4 n=1 Tax=Anguilla rostrata TaxID=7938 RepID=UPI0030CCE073